MNWTAVLHATATLLLGAGIFLSGRLLTFGLVTAAVVCFVAGIVVARRKSSDGPSPDVAG